VELGEAGSRAEQSRADRAGRASTTSRLKHLFFLLTFPLSSSLPQAVNVEISFGAAYGSNPALRARGPPRAMEMSWSGIYRGCHAGRLKSASRGITIMDPFRS
jgi:hypothetical protein